MNNNSDQINELKNETEVLAELAKSAVNGRLLLFIGTGFSKAVVSMCGITNNTAVRSWTELLREVCNKMDMNPNDYVLPQKAWYQLDSQQEQLNEIPPIQYDCPAIASKICREWDRNHSGNLNKTGVKTFKENISRLTGEIQISDKTKVIKRVFENIKPAGVVTTNYDDLLERILVLNAKHVAQNEVFVPEREKRIPIWHIHGDIQNPESIVITREDYQSFFRPENYVQRKLTMLFKEYTILFVGYSLNDINIETAVDWAAKVYETTKSKTYQIQLIHSETEGVVNRDKAITSMYTVPTRDCILFLEKLSDACSTERNEKRKRIEEIKTIIKHERQWKLSATENEQSIDQQFLNSIHLVQSLVNERTANPEYSFLYLLLLKNRLEKVSGSTMKDAHAAQARLALLCAVIKNLPTNNVPAVVAIYLGEELDNTFHDARSFTRESNSTYEKWKKETKTLPKETIDLLYDLAVRHNFNDLKKAIDLANNSMVQEAHNSAMSNV